MSLYKELAQNAAIEPIDNVKMHPPTGISVLVVGAGVGGLMAALECRRKGHDVQVIERTPIPSTAGDFFSISSIIIRHFQFHWPDLAEEVDRIRYDGLISYHKITGERISGPEEPTFADLVYTHPDGTRRTIKFHRHSRPKFVGMLLTQAKRIGINVTFGKRVLDYFEDETEQKGGVVLEDGTKLQADVVIAADGVGTKSHKLVSGSDIPAYPSGFSIFRTAFPIEVALDDPELRDRWPLTADGRSRVEMWQGHDLSFGVQRYNDVMGWFMTHKGHNIGVESWSHNVDASKVLEITSEIPGFPELANRLIQKTPKDGIIDWELMWRDPRETWVSRQGRVVQVGDSAHTFLPSSGSGATQAMEDAISLATCLQIGGRSNVRWATQIHNKLRFQRVSCFQINGFINHQRQNNTNFEVVDTNGQSFKSSIGKWAKHDPEQYAYDNYGSVLNHILTGAPFASTNIPPGFTYKPWTIKEMFYIIDSGKTLQFEGDWS
ncbi:putative monooxygenase [Xylariales sp. PMI_506]|nr:putative monooxygenase [Xylariales sp. PMI_506]